MARTLLALAAIAALAATTAASGLTPARSARHHHRYCYPRRTRAYRYRRPADQPRCRLTLAGTMDRGLPLGRKNGRAGRILRVRVRPGRHRLVDSFGQPFGSFEQVSLERFRIRKSHGGRWATLRHALLQVQGRGCMVSRALT